MNTSAPNWQMPLFVCLYMLIAPLFALGSDRTVTQFVHTKWGPKEGAPSPIQALAQDTDGYLWLGTPSGLYRFDGVMFERFEPQVGALLPEHNVRSLYALPNGDLWIGFHSGEISLLRNGMLTNYSVREGVPGGAVLRFAQDGEGRTWAATSAGLALFDGRRWRQVGEDGNFPGKLALTVFLDRQGTLWAASEDTLTFLPKGANTFQLTGIHVGQVLQIAEAPGGQLWIAETTRSVRPIAVSEREQPAGQTEIKVGSIGILFDQDGALWITTLGDGMRRSPSPEELHGKVARFGGEVESFTSKNGLSSDIVRCILEDREGNIWIGTQDGLDQFRKADVIAVHLPINPHGSMIAPGDAGNVWVDSVAHMFRVRSSGAFSLEGTTDTAHAAYRDSAGTIWWAGLHAFFRFKDGRFVRVPIPKELDSVYSENMLIGEDDSATLWVAVGQKGLFFLRGGVWGRLDTPSELAKLRPSATFTDSLGRVWFGYEDGTIIAVTKGKIQTISFRNQSLVGPVRAIQGRQGQKWVGGESGLAFFDGSRFRQVAPDDAAAFGIVSGIEQTSDGDLWLCESRGLIHIPAMEARQAMSSSSYRVRHRVFDSVDGLPGTFPDTPPWSREVQGTDGRVWFLTSNGIAWVDPAHILRNALPPQVAIWSVSAEGSQYASRSNLKLAPGTRNLQIRYTALSLSIPERVRFRYKLDGVDKDWQDAGARREAFYSNLGPGFYRFRVIACNNDGLWNEAGATLDFSITPAWYQTSWLAVLCAAAALFLIWALYRLRVRQVAASLSIRFDERLAERTRIAREIHDTLLQTMQGSKMVADDALDRPDDAAGMHRAMEQLSIWLGQAAQEGRETINALRTSTTQQNDLAQALRRATEDCERRSSMQASFSVIGDAKEMHPVMRDEVFRIGYEAIRNACRHSRGSRLEVRVSYSQDLTMRVADNGVGIDPAIVDEGKEGHFGLQGLRERAARIGANLTVVSSANVGTEITVVVPGSVVFRKPNKTPFEKMMSILRGVGRRSNRDRSGPA